VIAPNAHGTLLERTLAAGPAVFFQPIVQLRGAERQLFGMEALVRGPAGTKLEDPAEWLAEVRRCRKELDADGATLYAALAAAVRIPNGRALSVRVHAATLERDVRFPRFLAEVCEARGITPKRLIVGITHQRRFRDPAAFFTAVDRLRLLGASIALDDVGAGHVRRRLLVELRPDFYKIDRSLIHDCGRQPHARAMLDTLAELASKSGGRLVAQGVETASELETVAAAGVDLVQGPYISAPVRARSYFVVAEGAGVVPQCSGREGKR
jgi:EAL domain-containing protein (putative c-di-GMP-specific phosphodiesterase class I)